MTRSHATDMILNALVIFTALSLGLCKEECTLNVPTKQMRAEKTLRDHLLKCYTEITKPPVDKNSNSVMVKMEYLLQSFQFDYNEEIITLHSWNYFDWEDYRLTWKPEDYQGIKTTQIVSFDIWSPGLKLVNTANVNDFEFFYTKCSLNSTGHVRCVLRTEHKVFCTSNLTDWPYDTKTCTLHFDQWRRKEAKVTFSLSHIKYVMQSYENAGWVIFRERVFKNLTTGIQSTVKFELARIAEGLEATIVIPAFVLAVLTTTALLVDFRDLNRLGILCLSLISHFVFSIEISETIPKHSADCPVILLFISGSIAVTMAVFTLSFCFRRLGKKKSQPPKWIASFNDFVLDNYGRYLVVVKWKVNDQDLKIDKPNAEWIDFISVVNSICLLTVCVTYIALLAMYIPKKPVYNTLFFDVN